MFLTQQSHRLDILQETARTTAQKAKAGTRLTPRRDSTVVASTADSLGILLMIVRSLVMTRLATTVTTRVISQETAPNPKHLEHQRRNNYDK